MRHLPQILSPFAYAGRRRDSARHAIGLVIRRHAVVDVAESLIFRWKSRRADPERIQQHVVRDVGNRRCEAMADVPVPPCTDRHAVHRRDVRRELVVVHGITFQRGRQRSDIGLRAGRLWRAFALRGSWARQ